LFMIDEEGEMATVDVNAKFINGKPDAIECKYAPTLTTNISMHNNQHSTRPSRDTRAVG
jgi:photosystem II reaction center protein Psb28